MSLFTFSSMIRLMNGKCVLFLITLIEGPNLTLSWQRPLSYRNQTIDLLLRKSVDWFLYDNGLSQETVKIKVVHVGSVQRKVLSFRHFQIIIERLKLQINACLISAYVSYICSDTTMMDIIFWDFFILYLANFKAFNTVLT